MTFPTAKKVIDNSKFSIIFSETSMVSDSLMVLRLRTLYLSIQKYMHILAKERAYPKGIHDP